MCVCVFSVFVWFVLLSQSPQKWTSGNNLKLFTALRPFQLSVCQTNSIKTMGHVWQVTTYMGETCAICDLTPPQLPQPTQGSQPNHSCTASCLLHCSFKPLSVVHAEYRVLDESRDLKFWYREIKFLKINIPSCAPTSAVRIFEISNRIVTSVFDLIRNEHNYSKFSNTYRHRFLTYLREWRRLFTLATTPSNQQNLLLTMVQVLYLLEVFILTHYGPPSTETPTAERNRKSVVP